MTLASVLAAAGITYLITGSKLLGETVDAEGHALAPARPILERWWLSKSLVSCSFCAGFWVSLAVAHAAAEPVWAVSHVIGGAGAGVVLGAVLGESVAGWGVVGAIAGALVAAVAGLVMGPPAVLPGAFADAVGTAFAIILLHDMRDAMLRHHP